MAATEPHTDPRFLACLELVRRTGAHAVGVRYQDDLEPTVWMAVATWRTDADGRPTPHGSEIRHEAAGALHPTEAMFRLCEQAVIGGVCKTCGRTTGVSLEPQPMLHEGVCWWCYDPRQEKFVRGCRGKR